MAYGLCKSWTSSPWREPLTEIVVWLLFIVIITICIRFGLYILVVTGPSDIHALLFGLTLALTPTLILNLHYRFAPAGVNPMSSHLMHTLTMCILGLLMLGVSIWHGGFEPSSLPALDCVAKFTTLEGGSLFYIDDKPTLYISKLDLSYTSPILSLFPEDIGWNSVLSHLPKDVDWNGYLTPVEKSNALNIYSQGKLYVTPTLYEGFNATVAYNSLYNPVPDYNNFDYYESNIIHYNSVLEQARDCIESDIRRINKLEFALLSFKENSNICTPSSTNQYLGLGTRSHHLDYNSKVYVAHFQTKFVCYTLDNSSWKGLPTDFSNMDLVYATLVYDYQESKIHMKFHNDILLTESKPSFITRSGHSNILGQKYDLYNHGISSPFGVNHTNLVRLLQCTSESHPNFMAWFNYDRQQSLERIMSSSSPSLQEYTGSFREEFRRLNPDVDQVLCLMES